MKSGDKSDPAAAEAATFRARVTADETTVRRLADAVVENFEAEDVAVATFETGDGWAFEAYFRNAPHPAGLRALAALTCGGTVANALAFDRVAPRDWVAASLAGLGPVRAGRFVVHGRHDRGRIPPHAIGVEIEAALAFGTGHHGTTRGCLLALDAILKRRRRARRASRTARRAAPALPRARRGGRRVRRVRIADVGTGSGVLAIAAARATRCKVVAGDIDAQAVAAARMNANANGVGSLVTAVRAAGVAPAPMRRNGPYDLILANILLGPLCLMATPLAALLAPGGSIVLSGLLPAQAQAAVAAYGTRGLALAARMTLAGWTTLVMHKGSGSGCWPGASRG